MGDAPDVAMLADFLGDDLAPAKGAPASLGGPLQPRASGDSHASPWASDADVQSMLPLERMLEMLGQQSRPSAHHMALCTAQRQRPQLCAVRCSL